MSIQIKTDSEIASMRIGGSLLAETLENLEKLARPGISTYELDQVAEKFIRSHGGLPAFKGYHGFPATICTGLNSVIVHGIPSKEEILQEGDILTIDCGVIYEGFYTDSAITVAIGQISPEKEKFIKKAYEVLYKAIDILKPNLHLNEIGKLIQVETEKAGYSIVKDLTGHGVGKNLHEDPIILNYYDGTPGPILKPGMTLAIEPIFAMGKGHMRTLKDGWTIVTTDGSIAIQVEHTVLITQDGAEILTQKTA